MAKEEQKEVLGENVSESLSDEELFAGDVHQELSESEIFAGDEDLYKLLADSTKADEPVGKVSRRRFSILSIFRNRLSLLQKVLVVCIFAVASVLLYSLLTPILGPINNSMPLLVDNEISDIRQSPTLSTASVDSEQTASEIEPGTEAILPENQSLSLTVAREFYFQEEYKKAYAVYEQLRGNLPMDGEEVLRDFLQLKMAMCANMSADFEQAGRLFGYVCESRSPAVRVVANYYLTLLDIRRKQYLRAQTRSYKTIALIKAAGFDDDWSLSFECDCHFLVAECLSRHIFSLGNADSDLPDDLWGKSTVFLDPFDNLNESQLRRLLNSGSEFLTKGLLTPEILKVEREDGLPRWSIISYGAPVEELLSKFAAAAGLDIHWSFDDQSGSASDKEMLRQRAVSLYLPAATAHEVVLITTGSAGLLARLEDGSDKQKVTVFNPMEYSSLNEHISFLGQYATLLWQRFALTFHSDNRLANCHFVMGLLRSLMGMTAEAIGEYKLVANRFSRTSIAPFSLLHSSKLKMSILDHQGAREDLKLLIEQYPDTEIYGQAYLRLADATMQAGLDADAAGLYQRVFNFGLSDKSKLSSALGAAECFYKTSSYQDSAKWLIRYIKLAKAGKNDSLYSAYFLLGKSYMGLKQYQQACSAFHYALSEQNSREQYVEATKALVESYIEQGDFVEALDVLESVRSIALSQEQSVEMLVLKNRIFRLMALLDMAIVSLRDRAEYISVPELKAKLFFELAKCYIANGDLELARSKLTEVLNIVEPGPFAHEAMLELATICLKLSKNSQTVMLCLQLLESDPSAQIKQQTLKVLASAYNRQAEYEKAVLVLSGQWK